MTIDRATRTGDLVDRWAHDANVVDKDHHVTGRAMTPSGAQLHKSRHDEHGVGGAAKDTAIGLVEHVGPEILEHYGKYAAGAAGFLAGLAYFSYEATHELSKAEEKAAQIRGAFDNDAVNVALAKTLDFHPSFGAAEAKERPGVEKATQKLAEALNGKDAEMKPILQARADEGFLAAKRALDATKSVPAQERGAAMQKWFKDNGFGDRVQNDVAFGQGVKYALFCQSAEGQRAGVRFETEAAKVEHRQVPPQPFRAAG